MREFLRVAAEDSTRARGIVAGLDDESTSSSVAARLHTWAGKAQSGGVTMAQQWFVVPISPSTSGVKTARCTLNSVTRHRKDQKIESVCPLECGNSRLTLTNKSFETSVGAADAEQWHRPMADPRRRTNKIELTAGEGLPGANPKAEGAPAVGRTRNHPNLAKRGPYQILSWDL